MANTNNAINSIFTNNADGWLLGGGTTSRSLTLTGADIIISAVADATLSTQAQDGFVTLQDTITLTAGSIPYANVTGLLTQDNPNLRFDDVNNILITNGVRLSGRLEEDKGADVASADEVTLGNDGNYFDITGVTTINHLTNTGWQAGSLLTLQFDGILTVTHNAATPTGTEASIILATGTNFTTAAGDTITLRYDGVTFREIGRVGSGGSGSQNLWETMTGDTGTVSANILTDTFDIGGGTGISTAISGDGIVITNDSPNVDQNLFLNVLSDSGTAVADTATDTLSILGGTNVSTTVTGDVLTINTTGTPDQNLFLNVLSDAGTATADTTTDTLSILGGIGISTAVVADALTITNDSPNVDQNLFLNIAGDSGTAVADTTTDTLTIAGGTNVSTAVVGDTLTINATGAPDQNLFLTIAGDAGTNPVADSVTDTLSILGGTGITTTGSSAADSMTIAVDDDYLFNTGDTGTGVYDFGGATSFEIPNSAAPVVNVNGEIAFDTTVTDFSTGLLKFFGNEEQGVVSMPIAEFTTPTDGHVVSYNATSDEFELVAGGGASPLTTKGDVFTYDTGDARLPVGTNGQVLSADSAETTGLKWIANALTTIYTGNGSISGVSSERIVNLNTNNLIFGTTGSGGDGMLKLTASNKHINIRDTVTIGTIGSGPAATLYINKANTASMCLRVDTAAASLTFAVPDSGICEFNATGATLINRGSTAQRPGTPVNGMFRYNTTTSKFEGYEAGAWVNLI